MGAGASASIVSAINDSSVDDITATIARLPDADFARIHAVVNTAAAGQSAASVADAEPNDEIPPRPLDYHPVELKCGDELRVVLTELTASVGKFESFGFEIFSFFDKRQYGTYDLRVATDEEKKADNPPTHMMTLRFDKGLQAKKFCKTQEDVWVNMDKGRFLFEGEEE